MDENGVKTVSPEEVLKNGYTFIPTVDGQLSLVDKDYNIIIHDVENQPNLHDWIDEHKLWNKPNGVAQADMYQQVRNPKGMQTVRNAFQWGGNVAGAGLAAAVTAPFALEYAPAVAQYTWRNGVKPAVKALDKLFNPYTYHGAALTSATAAYEMNRFKDNPTLENGAYVTMSLLPFTPVAVKGAQAAAKSTSTFLSNHGIYDPYTTWRGRYGNYGNGTIDDIVQTFTRRFFPTLSKERTPQFFRKLKSPEVNLQDGRIDLTGTKNFKGQPHTNFTTDKPVLSHRNGNWDNADTYVVAGDRVLEQTPAANLKSIEPSDTFINGNRVIVNPKDVTVVSGNPYVLNQARENGMQTLSSQRLRDLYQRKKIQVDPSATYNFSEAGRFNLEKPVKLDYSDYAAEQARLLQQKGRPTLRDYQQLEQRTGQNAGVEDLTQWKNAYKAAKGQFSYPNGEVVNRRRPFIEQNYSNVVYDPSSPVEFNWRNPVQIQSYTSTYNPSITPINYQQALTKGKITDPNHRNYFQYNAFLDSHFYSEPTKALIEQFKMDGDMSKLQQALKSVSPEQANEIRNFIRTYNFSNERVPYYTDMGELLKDHPALQRAVNEMPHQAQQNIYNTENAVINTDEDLATIVTDQSVLQHEMEHVLQRKRWFPGSYMPQQESLLNDAYVHTTDGSPAANMLEKGAINNQIRGYILDQFKKEKGYYPAVEELQQYIDSYPEEQLKQMIHSLDYYGNEYSKLNIKKVKQALKYVGVLSVPLVVDKSK